MLCTFYDHGIRCSLDAAPGVSCCILHHKDGPTTPRHEPTPIEHPPGLTHPTHADNPWPPTPITHEKPPKSWVKPTNTHEFSAHDASALGAQHSELAPQSIDPAWE